MDARIDRGPVRRCAAEPARRSRRPAGPGHARTPASPLASLAALGSRRHAPNHRRGPTHDVRVRFLRAGRDPRPSISKPSRPGRLHLSSGPGSQLRRVRSAGWRRRRPTLSDGRERAAHDDRLAPIWQKPEPVRRRRRARPATTITRISTRRSRRRMQPVERQFDQAVVDDPIEVGACRALGPVAADADGWAACPN